MRAHLIDLRPGCVCLTALRGGGGVFCQVHRPWPFLHSYCKRAGDRPAVAGPFSDMDNILWDELPVEKLYEHFTQANDLPYVVRSFDALKTKLELNGLEGIALFRALQLKLGTQKMWKARDVLRMLDKRANQQEYMQQTAAKGVKVLIGEKLHVHVDIYFSKPLRLFSKCIFLSR